ncbi:hypothetical protein Tco_0271114 [Tanacetum coccineum]
MGRQCTRDSGGDIEDESGGALTAATQSGYYIASLSIGGIRGRGISTKLKGLGFLLYSNNYFSLSIQNESRLKSEPGASIRRHTRSYYPKRYWELLPKEILGATTQRDTGSYYPKRYWDVLWENGGNLGNNISG